MRLAFFWKSLLRGQHLGTQFWIWGMWRHGPPKALRVLSRIPARIFFKKHLPPNLSWGIQDFKKQNVETILANLKNTNNHRKNS